MNRALTIARAMHIAGSHLHNCFADKQTQQRGWQQMQQAKRICRKLGWRPEAVLP